MIKVGTDFSGVGAPEQALKELGIDHEVMFACEKDKYARITYMANHSCNVMYDDITLRDNDAVEEVDLYCFGFPCQAFSISGKRKGFDDIRGTLFFNAADYIQKKRPKVFIAENVKGLLSHDKPKNSKAIHGRTFSTIIGLLAKTINGQHLIPFYEDNLGYNIFYKVLNSKNFGVPQNRERIFIIGFRDDVTYDFPKGFPLEKRLKDILESDVDEKYFLSDTAIKYLQKGASGGYSDRMAYLNKEDNITAGCITANHSKGVPYNMLEVTEVTAHSLFPRSSKTGKGGTGHLSKNDGTAYALDTGCSQAVEVSVIAQRGRYEEDGSIQQQLEERTDGITNTITSVQKDNLIKVGVMSGGVWDKQHESARRVYSDEGIAPTVNAMGGGNLHPKVQTQSRIRRLTPRECCRLQGFADTFDMSKVSDSQGYKQMGNSITVPVLKAIIKNILNYE